MSELRKDPITGRWVIVLDQTVRDYALLRDEEPDEGPDNCPFCPGSGPDNSHEILVYRSSAPKAKWPWDLRVIPHRVPILRVEEVFEKKGEGIFDKISGVGAHEVIIETPEHDLQFADFGIDKIVQVLSSYRDRMCDLRNDVRLKYAMVFKHYGKAAGARLRHSHSQLVALPFVPFEIEEELKGARHYYRQKERCIYCDIIGEEIRFGRRVVEQRPEYISIVPYAATSAFKTWILPKDHLSHFEEISHEQIRGLAEILGSSLKRLNRALPTPPYQFMIHTNPLQGREHPYFHWHIEITPILRFPIAFEREGFTYLNSVAPEEAAQVLRGY